MNAKHTPGPWTVEVYREHTNVEGACSTVAADVSNEDAHLIAAAPEMLEALKDAEQAIIHLQGEIACEETLRFIGSVIAKAEGRS